MYKRRKWMLAFTLFLLIGLLIYPIVSYCSMPKLSRKEKKIVHQAYVDTRQFGSEEGWLKVCPLIWYDENGYAEEVNVWRYIGTYGDCYAFLVIGDDLVNGVIGVDIPKPYLLRGLSYDVYYPVEAEIYLYDTLGKLPTYTNSINEIPVRLRSLYGFDDQKWLTDAQLEQLTRDVEKIANQHK